MRTLPFLALTLLVLATPTHAATLQYQVNYLVTGGCTTIANICLPVQTGIVIPGTFFLNSAALSTPGSYDISPSFTSGLLIPVAGFTETAAAVVTGGKVTDVSVSYGWTVSTFAGTDSYVFSASGGKWSSFEDAIVQGGGGTRTMTSGPYTISSIPEPGSAALLIPAGLLVLAGRRRRLFRTRLQATGSTPPRS